VLGISNLHISTIFQLNAGTVPTVCYIFVHFILGYEKKTSNNRKRRSQDFCMTIGQWSGDRRRKCINKPKRGYCFTMRQTSFGRMESFIFLYI
jgi:hypothetical protein